MCERQETKKYTSRKSPPYPANECKGTEKIGTEGKMYISVGNKNGVHRWVKMINDEEKIKKHIKMIDKKYLDTKSSKKSSIKTKSPTKSPKGVCKPDQIINPATGRCVLKTGAIGKKLLDK